MLAKVEDLRKGDVILTSSSKGIYEAKLLRQPALAKTGKLKTWWGATRWTSILCAVREETTQQVYNYVDNSGVLRSHTYTNVQAVIANGQEYTREKRLDLTDKQVWIIKRETL